MRRIRTALGAVALLATLAVSVVAAQEFDFFSGFEASFDFGGGGFAVAPNATAGQTATVTLRLNWTEVGLGSNKTTSYIASADFVATYACANKGGNFPRDPKKISVEQRISKSLALASDGTGKIVGTTTLDAPAAPTSTPPACTSGQVPVLLAVSATNITITDTTNGRSATIPGPISVTVNVLP